MFELTSPNAPRADIFMNEDVPVELWKLHPSLEESVFTQATSVGAAARLEATPDRKSTRLNSSHLRLSRMPSSA